MKRTIIRALGIIISLCLLLWKQSQAQSFLLGNSFQNSGYQFTAALSVDPSGNAIRCGTFQSNVDFDPSPSSHVLNASRGPGDLFIHKSDPSGNFLWVVSIGNNSNINAEDITTDIHGNIFVTGTFQRTVDFNPSPATFNLRSNGSDDVFILKLSPSGNFIHAIAWGGSSNDKPRSIIINSSGNLLCSGSFKNTCDFDPSLTRSFSLNSSGNKDGFVTQLTNNLTFIHAIKIGGSGNDQINALSIDSSKNILCTGYFENTADLNPETAVASFTSTGSQDGFILKLNSTLNFTWAYQIQGSGVQFPADIACDELGNIFITGYFTGWTDFDPSPTTLMRNSAGQEDIFIQKYSPAGTMLWTKTIGGREDETPYSLALAQGNKPVISGYFDSHVDFDPGASTFLLRNNDEDGFMLLLDTDGNFVFAGQTGGDDDDYLKDISVFQRQYIYGAGNYSETADINPTSGTYNVTTPAEKAAYLFKLQIECTSTEIHQNATACSSYTWNSETYSETGTYRFTKRSSACDTNFILHLTITPPDTSYQTIHLCEGKSILINGETISNPGIYANTYTSYLGCDSVTRIQVIQDSAVSSSVNYTLCFGESVSLNGIEYTSSGNYTQFFSRETSCDSIFQIQITILPENNSHINASVCDGESYTWLGQTYFEPGDYSNTLTSIYGCDSIVTLHLQMVRHQIVYMHDIICEGSTYHMGGFSTSSEGNHTISLKNIFGCDSIVELNLVRAFPSSSTFNVNICDVYVSPSGKYRWVDSGTYHDTISNYAGCDSFMSMDVTIRRCTVPGDPDNRCFPTNLATMNHYSNWMFYPFNNSDNPHIDTTFGTTLGSSAAASEVYGSCDGVLPGRMKTVWLRFKAPSCAVQTLRISTNTISTDFNTRLTVYKQTIPTSCTSGLTEIACNNDVGTLPRPLSSEIILTPGTGYGHYEEGEIYVLQISGYNGDAGNYGLIVEANTPDVSVNNIGTSQATVHILHPDSIPGSIYRGSTIKYSALGSPGYVVQRTLDSLSDSINITTLMPGTTYNVWNQYQCVDYPWLSKRETFTTLPGCSVGTPLAPNIRLLSSSPYHVSVNWSPTAGASSYRLFWRVTGSSSFSFANVTDTFYNVILVSSASHFEFWVEASCNVPMPVMRRCSPTTAYSVSSTSKNASSDEESSYIIGNLEFHNMEISEITKYLDLTSESGEHEFDLEGKTEFIPNHRITSTLQKGEIELYPNPAILYTELKYAPKEPENEYQVKVYSLDGACLARYKVNPTQGELKMHVPTHEFAEGMYIIRIDGVNDSKSIKLIVTK